MMLQMHFEEREVYAKGGSELEEMWTWGPRHAIWQGGVNKRIHCGAMYNITTTSCITVLNDVERQERPTNQPLVRPRQAISRQTRKNAKQGAVELAIGALNPEGRSTVTEE